MDLESRVGALMRAERWSDAIALLADHDAITRAESELARIRGWAHYELGELDAAEIWLERAVDRDPGSVYAVATLGWVLHEAGKVRQAEQRLLAGLSVRESVVIRMGLAFLYLAQGRLEEAEAVHLEALARRPNDPRLRGAYAAFLDDVGRKEEAVVQTALADEGYRERIQARPEQLTPIHEYVTFLREEGRDEDADLWERRLHEA